MTRSRRPSAQTTAVVLALAEEPAAWRYGYQLCRQLDIKPGSLYPILMRLTDRGMLETAGDTEVPAGRPPRHLYRLTGSGQPLAAELAAPTPKGDATRRPGLTGGVAGRMSRLRRRLATVTGIAAVAWVVFYAVALATAEHPAGPVTAVAQLVVPPLLRVALRQIGSPPGSPRGSCYATAVPVRSRTPGLDLPRRMLAAAVATLPERRREWGGAMIAELAEIRDGRPAGGSRSAVPGPRSACHRRAAGRSLALVTGAVVAAVAAAGSAIGAVVPGLTVFAATFTGLVGAMLVLAVARSRRLRLPVPAPTILVAGAVAASIAATVIFLRQEPAAAQHLPPPAAMYLATVLAGCLWFAVAPPRSLGTGRLAPHLGAAAAVVFAAWSLLSYRTDGDGAGAPALIVLAAVLVVLPSAAFFAPAFAAGGPAGRSPQACGPPSGPWPQ